MSIHTLVHQFIPVITHTPPSSIRYGTLDLVARALFALQMHPCPLLCRERPSAADHHTYPLPARSTLPIDCAHHPSRSVQHRSVADAPSSVTTPRPSGRSPSRPPSERAPHLQVATTLSVSDGVACWRGFHPRCSSSANSVFPSSSRYIRRLTTTSPNRVTTVRSRNPSTLKPFGLKHSNSSSSAWSLSLACSQA